MRLLRSLRAQLAVSAAVLVLVIVALSGLIIVLQQDASARADLDESLRSRLAKVTDDGRRFDDPSQPGRDGGTDSLAKKLLAGSDSLARVVVDDQVVAQRGETVETPIPVPTETGYSTILVEGEPWRSLVGDTEDGVRLQILQRLAPIEHRLAANTGLVVIVTAIGTILAVIGGWLVARVVLRPLERLAAGASAIRVERDAAYRLPTVGSPQEVAELSTTLNGMLERLQRGMQATRRFTADAGHELRTPLASLGVYLDTLQRNPGLPEDQRDELLLAAAEEHRRMASLLEGLQMLARGDAEVLPAREPVDLLDLAADAVARARRRHPAVSFALRDALPEGTGLVPGWRTGLGLAIDNLLDNAARHGRPEGEVRLDLEAEDERLLVRVADDGPGIPEGRRATIAERFVRGSEARGSGSGLGLALVEQQAGLHGGRLELSTSDLGGLAATIVLPRGGGGARVS